MYSSEIKKFFLTKTNKRKNHDKRFWLFEIAMAFCKLEGNLY